MLTVKNLLEREDFFDGAILRHGFTDYIRDYEIIVGGRNGPPYKDVHKYQFIGCVEAVYTSKIRPEAITQSLSDEFVYSGPDYPDKDDPKGFIWGVRYSNAYPGWAYSENGKQAKRWTKLMNRKMHEFVLETEAFQLTLVFADVRYSYLGDEPEFKLSKDYPLPRTDPTSDGGVS